MPNTFGDKFTKGDSKLDYDFYTLLKTCADSTSCHKTILELFMNALKLSSARNRKLPWPKPSPTGIPNGDTLDIVLGYIPQELQDPMSQVMFEQWNVVDNKKRIGNNAWYIKTYTNTTQANLQTAVDRVRADYYTQLYNDLQADYKAIGWTISTIPDVLPNASTKDAVIEQIQQLKNWINTNDPEIIALTNLYKPTDSAEEIINHVFGSTPIDNISITDFCEMLTNNIRDSKTERLTSNGTGLVRLFLDTVHDALKTNDNFWQTNATLELSVREFINDVVDPYWRLHSFAAFRLINQIFQAVLILTDEVALNAAKTAIAKIFKDLNTAITAKPYYLKTTIENTRNDLLKTVNYDPFILDSWAKELNEDIPITINYGFIEVLMKECCSVIQSIPLKFNSDNVCLFPFSNFNDLTSGGSFDSGTDLASDTYTLNADPREYTKDLKMNDIPFRPIYEVSVDSTNGTFLKFFNVGGAGTFHFTDATNASLVKTVNFSNPKIPLSFDFDALTINGEERVPKDGIKGEDEKIIMDAGTPYRVKIGRSISRANFWKAVKLLSKWKNLNGQRKYDVLYMTSSFAKGYDAHLIWYAAPGNLDRTDEIDDSLYVWQWMADDKTQKKYAELPGLIGLSDDRRIQTKPLKLSDKIKIDVVYIKEKGAQSDSVYVQTNTPSLNLPAEVTKELNKSAANASVNSDAVCIMNIFNFKYFRRIDTTFNKVIKNLPAKNRPLFGINLDDSAASPSIIGINMPVIPVNVNLFKTYIGASLKNKGNALFRAKGKRQKAGTVMNALRGQVKPKKGPPGRGSLSATDLANWILSKSGKYVQSNWQNLKVSTRKTLPTDQEWCHLLGHGDGGDERLGNFVSGSYHCNTEQLAMESKERRSITQAAVKGTYELRSTAYLFNDNGELLDGNYLNNDLTFKKMTDVYNKNRQAAGKVVKPSGAGRVMPLAAFIRYKMYGSVDTTGGTGGMKQKLFDHIFEGQSEFMDEHQFNILKYASYFAVAGMQKFSDWYKEQTDIKK